MSCAKQCFPEELPVAHASVRSNIQISASYAPHYECGKRLERRSYELIGSFIVRSSSLVNICFISKRGSSSTGLWKLEEIEVKFIQLGSQEKLCNSLPYLRSARPGLGLEERSQMQQRGPSREYWSKCWRQQPVVVSRDEES